MTSTDWNPHSYGRFEDVRLQPALDLLGAVKAMSEGDVVDLGCGAGVMGTALKGRFPKRRVLGVDASPAMLGKASTITEYDTLELADAAVWAPKEPPALIFSNAVLQWLDDHCVLLPRLARTLTKGGVLAVQVPRQQQAPSSHAWRAAYAETAGGAPDAKTSEVLSPEAYFDLLSPLGQVRVWETEYHQHLKASTHGHPVRLYTESTFGRPFLDPLSEIDQQGLIAAYEKIVTEAYPLRPDGTVLFPFRRLFFLLET